MAELSHGMNGMQTHAALAKMFPDHKEILKDVQGATSRAMYIPTQRGVVRLISA